MRILFESGMTFHFRSLLPVMKQLVDKKIHVSVQRRGYFAERRIKNRPRAFNDVTKASLQFVAQQIGLDHHFLDKVRFVFSIRRLNFPPESFYRKQDMFISTTKGFPWLNRMAKYGKPRIAIGYQNFLGTYYTNGQELFPEKCPPNLNYEQEVSCKTELAYQETGHPFMDSYVNYYRNAQNNKTNKVLLLHPGGYRNVITRMGESKSESYRKQIAFYEKILACIPSEMKLSVKIHPLAARYHDRKAHEMFAKTLNFEIVEGFLGEILFNYDAVLSVGSSSFFEILPFGRSLWVLGFLSSERTKLYKDFPSLFVYSAEELYAKLKNNENIFLQKEFEQTFYERLKKTADGFSTKRIMEIIDGYY